MDPPLAVGSLPESPPVLASESRDERPHPIRATAPSPTHTTIRPLPRLIPTLSHCLSRSTRGRKCPPGHSPESERPEEAHDCLHSSLPARQRSGGFRAASARHRLVLELAAIVHG